MLADWPANRCGGQGILAYLCKGKISGLVMAIEPLFKPQKMGRPMRVAAFMSGSGTNIHRLLEHQKRLKTNDGRVPFEVVFIFSDRSDGACAGEKIALNNGLPYFSYDIRAFHRQRSMKRTATTPEGLAARKEYDRVAQRLVETFEIDVIALVGYMRAWLRSRRKSR